MGLFEFYRVPYGLKNSGSSFVRAIIQILNPIHEVAKSFADDVAVHSKMWYDHMCDLEKFLKTIEQSGLTLNFKKCKWAQKQVKFCGKIVGSGKILADPEKLTACDGEAVPAKDKEGSEKCSDFSDISETTLITMLSCVNHCPILHPNGSTQPFRGRCHNKGRLNN